MNDETADRGFIPFDRALFESEMFRSFTAQQRAVVLELYGLANWAPRSFFARGERIEVGRGELAHSLRTIAERIPGCTKDVVDGVVRTLQRWGYLEARHPTAQPTGPRVLTLRRYLQIGDEAATEPTTEATPSRQRADNPPDTEPTERREEERKEQEEKRGGGACAPVVPLHGGAGARALADADVGAVLEMARRAFQELRGARYAFAADEAAAADHGAAERMLEAAAGDVGEIERRWRAALVHEGFPRIDTLADLARHWPRFAPAPGEARRRLAAGAPEGAGERRSGTACAGSCPQWDRLTDRLRRRIRPDLFERWFAPLHAETDGDGLVLIAPDPYAAGFVQDNYAAWLTNEARALGSGVRCVRVISRKPELVAAGRP